MKKFPFFITVFALISASVPSAYAWTNPTANPASGAGAVFVEAGAAANAIYIKSNGNVGVGGTTNPTDTFYINAVINSGNGLNIGGVFKLRNSTSSNHFVLEHLATTGDLYIRSDSDGTGADTGNIIINDQGGNVGIGTASPTTKLDVNGTIKATSFEGALSGTTSAANISAATFGSNTGGGSYTFPANLTVGTTAGALTVNGNITSVGGDLIANTTGGQGYPDVRFQGAGGEVIARNDGGRLWLMTATTGSMRVNIADAYDNDRGVGLAYTPGTSGTPGGVFDIGQTQKNSVGYTHGITRFYTNGAEQMRIDASGRVGIGTTNPGQKLHVSGGSIRIDAGSTPLVISETDQTLPLGMWRIPADGGGFRLDRNTSAAGDFVPYKTSWSVNSSGLLTLGEALQISIPSAGNMGIGVTAPAYPLDVRQAVTASGAIANGVNLQQTLTAAANNDVLTALKVNPTFVPGAYTGVTSYAIDATGTIKATAFEGGLSGTVSAGNVSSGDFGSLTGGGNYAFPANVRIGGTPVDSNVRLQLSESGQHLNLLTGKKLTGTWPPVSEPLTMTLQSSGSSAGNLAFATGNSEIMRVTSTGNVGIGTAAPTAKLDVGDVSANLLKSVVARGPENNYLGVKAYDTQPTSVKTFAIEHFFGSTLNSSINFYRGGSTSGGFIRFATNNGTEQVTINYQGNVGIGTTAPATLLHLSQGAGNNPTATIEGTANGAAARLDLISNSQSWRLENQNNKNSGVLSVQYAGAEKMVITTDGKVGIGTLTPVAALDMGASGGIRLGGVTRTTWPGGLDTPIYTSLIYGSAGDLPWRTTSTTPQTMRYLYYPFLGGMPTCPSGYTKQHRLYGEVVDNISTGGQATYVRIAFDGGLTRDFSLGSTWGGSPSYKTYLSALFTETNTNHANIQAWVNGVAGPYIEIRRLELRTYCI